MRPLYDIPIYEGNIKKEKHISNSKFFNRKVRKDLISFLKNLIIDAKANN